MILETKNGGESAMKNMKKLLQRAMVFTLTAAMLVGTPLTASAAGLVDLYSISDGNPDHPNTGSEPASPTGTVTNTDTNTNTGILKNNEEAIIGIVLDKDYVNAEKGVKETLKATFITANGTLDGTDKERNVLEQLAGKIKWEVLFADGNAAKNGVAANEVLSISASAADRTVVTLNPRQGTVKDEEMIVRAKVEGRYFFNVDGSVKELTDYNSTEGYEAEAKVYIKEYSEGLKFENLPTAYAKHTINLNNYLVRTPATANDDITWISSDTKVATVTAAGVVTFKKAADTANLTITAVSERGKKAVWTISAVDAGTPASKVEILETADATTAFKTTTTDLNTKLDGWKDITKVVYVKMYAKEKAYTTDSRAPETTSAAVGADVEPTGTLKLIEMANGTKYIGEDKKVHVLNVTDEIDWSSNKAAIASVAGGKASATLTAKSVGKATITAKTSSGKKANLAVTVKATLDTLTITNKETKLYTGQSLQMTYTKDPAKSTDAVVWSIEKVNNRPNPNATINSKGVLTIKPKLAADCKTVTVLLQSKKAVDRAGGVKEVVVAEKKVINLVQSNITDIKVMKGNTVIADAEVVNGKVKANQRINKTDNKTILNVPVTGTYKVEVKGGSADTLAWKSSNANVAEITSTGDQVRIKANKSGTATITVSGAYENGTKASAIKTTFKVTVQQPAKTLTLNKPSVVLNQKNNKQGVAQKQTVSFKATLGPKGAKKETVIWTLDAATSAAELKNGKLTMNAPVVGDVFVVTASVPTGAKATATVKILNKTTGVAIAQKADLNDGAPELFTWTNPKNQKTTNNATEVELGGKFKMYPFVNISATKGTADWKTAGATNCEGVTYTVNKKGIVTIGSDGTVYGIKPGTVTITAKTPTNKKATLKVTVK